MYSNILVELKKNVFLTFVLLLLSSATVAGFSEQWIDEGVIFIRANGRVEGTDKIQQHRDTYIFTDNINVADTYLKAIVVERENIPIDGAGHTLQGWGAVNSKGIDVSGISDISIRNLKIREFCFCIYLNSASNIEIEGNNLTANDSGIGLWYSSNIRIFGDNLTANLGSGINCVESSRSNKIYRNEITANTICGIALYGSGNSIYKNNITRNGEGIILCSSGNSIYENKISNHDNGIRLSTAFNNSIYHNSFVNNTRHVYDLSWDETRIPPSINLWNDEYPSGGNYWREYIDVDQYSGLDQNEAGSDGTWDHPYVLDENNRDNYPLTNPWIPLPPELLPTWLIITIIVVAVDGTAVLVLFIKFRKPNEARAKCAS
jgi:parallel beta-helix repeat protein